MLSVRMTPFPATRNWTPNFVARPVRISGNFDVRPGGGGGETFDQVNVITVFPEYSLPKDSIEMPPKGAVENRDWEGAFLYRVGEQGVIDYSMGEGMALQCSKECFSIVLEDSRPSFTIVPYQDVEERPRSIPHALEVEDPEDRDTAIRPEWKSHINRPVP
jgi:hypothetical protein